MRLILILFPFTHPRVDIKIFQNSVIHWFLSAITNFETKWVLFVCRYSPSISFDIHCPIFLYALLHRILYINLSILSFCFLCTETFGRYFQCNISCMFSFLCDMYFLQTLVLCHMIHPNMMQKHFNLHQNWHLWIGIEFSTQNVCTQLTIKMNHKRIAWNFSFTWFVRQSNQLESDLLCI